MSKIKETFLNNLVVCCSCGKVTDASDIYMGRCDECWQSDGDKMEAEYLNKEKS